METSSTRNETKKQRGRKRMARQGRPSHVDERKRMMRMKQEAQKGKKTKKLQEQER